MSHEVEDIVQRWKAGQTGFSITTSGSTGQPKPFLLQRSSLIWSAQQTLKHFITSPGKQLICLPLTKVGGFMQVVRAMVWNQPFYQVTPSSNPLMDLNLPQDCTIASFTPHQLYHILQLPESRNRLKQFKSVLIGGGEVSDALEKELIAEFPEIQFIHTFGMTETYSHFAGRKLGEEWYQLTDHIEIKINELGCLMIISPLASDTWMTTQDIVEIHPNGKQFRWLGRSDFTINSGGVKIQLETVEKYIRRQLNWNETDFFCWGMSHESLGQELTLFIKKTMGIQNNPMEFQNNPKEIHTKSADSLTTKTPNSTHLLKQGLIDTLSQMHWQNPYERPRRIEFVDEILMTETQKIKRKESVMLWENQ